MKFFTILLLTFAIFFGCVNAAEETEHLSFYWSGDEDDLDLYVTIKDGLEIPDEYTTTNFHNGAGCEIFFKPIPGVVVLSTDGDELKYVNLKVQLFNTDKPNRVTCKILITNCYKGLSTHKTTEISVEVLLHTPSIDATQSAEFYYVEDSLNERVISFKNLFPCRLMHLNR